MDNTKVKLKKYMIVTIGQIIIGIGCAFLVTSGMGNDPMGVMVSGFSRLFGISFGTTTNIIYVIMFAFLRIFYRKRLALSTVITVFVIGWTIDPVCAVLGKITVPVWINNIIYPILGCVIISVGVAFYLSIDFGASIADNIILMIADLTCKSYAFGCNLLYLIFIIVGVRTKGVWGYATILALAINGKLIDALIPKFQKTVAVWANK